MIDFNKNPLKHIDERSRWWQEFSEKILKVASNLEDELYDTFRDGRYGEFPDVDAPIVRRFVDLLYGIYEDAQHHQQDVEVAEAQFDAFCNYWVHGQGKWNGIHEFLQEEVKCNA